MATLEEIRNAARQRAREMKLPYTGALLPAEAAQMLELEGSAKLVDVRSSAEWNYVGRIPGAVEIEWKSYPGMVPNPKFAEQLQQKVALDAPLMFICRSGARSHDTAVLANRLGYREVYNVLQGFEGDRDAHGHRNTVGGWRVAGLPWMQS
ncbi:MAG TPA: rhodanese-like domain-containing protein [Burkholderiales bacterium]|nr:rhodanese-like domain-containing protein [Burkholderiales bacterium]